MVRDERRWLVQLVFVGCFVLVVDLTWSISVVVVVVTVRRAVSVTSLVTICIEVRAVDTFQFHGVASSFNYVVILTAFVLVICFVASASFFECVLFNWIAVVALVIQGRKTVILAVS